MGPAGYEEGERPLLWAWLFWQAYLLTFLLSLVSPPETRIKTGRMLLDKINPVDWAYFISSPSNGAEKPDVVARLIWLITPFSAWRPFVLSPISSSLQVLEKRTVDWADYVRRWDAAHVLRCCL